MAKAMLDARQEGDSYRRVEVITGERRRRRWTGEELSRLICSFLLHFGESHRVQSVIDCVG